jgi:rRNA maturation endonuclease Nob1
MTERCDDEDEDELHWLYLCADCGNRFHVPGPSLRGLDLPLCPVCGGPAAGSGAREWRSSENDKHDE